MTPRAEAAAGRKRRKPRRRRVDASTLPLSDQLSRWYAVRLRHHRWLALGATLAVVGVGLVGSQEPDIGAVAVLAGLITLVFSIHRFGRLSEEV